MLGCAQILALTIAYESANQGNVGMEAVASTIWNRSQSHSSLEMAMLCIEPKQFSCWNNHNPSMEDINYWHESGQPNMFAYRRALEIAISMIYGTFKPIHQATHYHTVSVKPDWASSMQVICRMGLHIFYKERERA